MFTQSTRLQNVFGFDMYSKRCKPFSPHIFEMRKKKKKNRFEIRCVSNEICSCKSISCLCIGFRTLPNDWTANHTVRSTV